MVASRAARGHRRVVFGLTSVLALLVFARWPARAQDGADSVSVTPGIRYRGSGLHRFFFGSTYRDLWATTIKVPVLRLGDSTGGLTPTEKAGGKQTQGLRLSAGDGRSFVFRMFDKDPTKVWPELAKRVPLARSIAEDQTSALFPAGALTVAVLEEAAGLLHPDQQLVFLADDPRLGQWRDEFKNKLGWLELRLKGKEDLDAFPGAVEIVPTEKLYPELIKSGKNVVDEREYLKARLFDLFVGDWDRHYEQWNWVRYDEHGLHRWMPFPRDRDWALSRLNGPIYAIVRQFAGELQNFGGDYGSIAGLTYPALPLDRRLLSALGKPVWDSIATELTSRITDSVIARAVSALPAALYQRIHVELDRELRSRRDRLPTAADRFYRLLAKEIELWGSNDPDQVTFVREPDGGLDLTVARGGKAILARRLVPGETKELRLILFQGPDTVRFEGPGPARIRVRVVTGAGANLVVDSTGKGDIRVYDDSGSTVVQGPIGRAHRRFESPIDPTSPKEIRHDWGWSAGLAPWFEIGPEVGLLIGGGPKVTQHGFRKDPYRSQLAFRLAYSTGAAGFDADLNGDIRLESPLFHMAFRAAVLSTGIQRYYGLGNETPVPASDTRLNVVLSKQYQFEPMMQLGFGNVTLGVGGKIQSSNTDLVVPSLIATDRPYGSGSFTEAGATVSAKIDTRDHPTHPTSGLVIEAQGAIYPRVFDVRETFETASIEARTYLTARPLPTKPTLALRAGASRAWNETPFFELPSLGSIADLRAVSSRRFLGDRAVHGSAELRLDFGKFTILAPGTWGIYGLTDVGRVYLTGQESDRWHSVVGGGLWFAFIDRRSTFTATYASSDEGGRIFIQAGFHF
jgi:hypothetical protein